MRQVLNFAALVYIRDTDSIYSAVRCTKQGQQFLVFYCSIKDPANRFRSLTRGVSFFAEEFQEFY